MILSENSFAKLAIRFGHSSDTLHHIKDAFRSSATAREVLRMLQSTTPLDDLRFLFTLPELAGLAGWS